MRRRAFWVGLALAVALTLGPYLIPLPPLEDTLPPEDLADEDSRFIEVDGLRLHYKEAGQGEPALVLLHGFGASTFSWRRVLGPLARKRRVVAFDRPGFGLSQRPLRPTRRPSPYSPEGAADLTAGLMRALGIRRAVLVGNSAGGTVALLTYLRHPDPVAGLILVSPAIHLPVGVPPVLRPLFRTPPMERLGVALVRAVAGRSRMLLERGYHDPSRITSEDLEGYLRFLKAHDWDRALWHLALETGPVDLRAHLPQVRVPTLMVTGDDDRLIPTAVSVELAVRFPHGELAVLPDCGHLPQEECPEAFLEAVEAFLERRSLQ